MYKVYVIGDQIQVTRALHQPSFSHPLAPPQVVRRPSLADMHVHNGADLDAAAKQNECVAVHVASSAHGGYLSFNSADLTKGRSTALPPCKANTSLHPRLNPFPPV